MYYIIYLSAGTNWFSQPELEELLAISAKNNMRDNITGLLLYAEGNFIQLLEGEEKAVKESYDRISQDERHKGITPIANGVIEHRIFPEWAMGFKTIGSFRDTPFKDFLNPEYRHKSNLLPVTLLNSFIKTAKI
ncbi:BLUF domain-containing protein [Mucilaginibacter sp.]|uniref:BLUF domain-containing protein n=1 Tax=Mucilaginibacter sp. TaxID=1882438 RepID=UPI0025F1197B|nr:BLUF domain-containing protein [Mucilaginibacter sp.]